MISFLFGVAVGVVIGIVVRTLWNSRKMDQSGTIVKDSSLTTEQKLEKLKELWKIK